MTLSSDLFLLVLRVLVGLVMAAHGAQKVFGSFGGPGLEGFRGRVATLGLPPRPFAEFAAFGEFLGGLALALGIFTPIAAGALAVDMLVAIVKVHWPKGLWVTKGGYEFALTLMVICALFGLAGPGAYAFDQQLGLVRWSGPIFVVVFAGGAIITAIASRRGADAGTGSNKTAA